MDTLARRFQRYIVIGLLGLMTVVVFLSTVELAVVLVQQLLKPPRYLLDIREMLVLFSFFLMVLIGLELWETLRIYLSESVVHVEVILMVAIIAVSRKVIVLNIESLDPLALLGIAAIIVALSTGYYVVKKALAMGAPGH